jgi:hypothetical protein
MAAINIPGYGDIVPLSADAEKLVQSEDPEHVSRSLSGTAAAQAGINSYLGW